ncbi:MAG: flagellar export chaperone FliS [Gammaproteobacteria bacterium]|nr:flagellar export chaperone FliS [Gammaproteobacteria bacterium]MCW9004225.1 flagellar export chaperone FliS [Gammaproteobacteria bacterium]MCW9056174.1 flagellar export chaperone FliS [Gammaproteobacteria bacterium]
MHTSAAVNQYKKMGTNVAAETADPHQLIQMLLNGAVERINAAKYHIQNNDVAQKGEQISKSISILDGLKVSLDMEKGGEIAANLEALYDYMQRQLLMANLENKTENLDEVLSLLNEIRAGWAQIPQDIRNTHKPEM